MILALLLCLGCLPVRSEKIDEIFVSCIDPAKSSGSNITNYHRQYGISRSENKVYGLSAIDSVIARINNLTPLPTKDFRTIEVNYKICLISNKTIKREVYGGRNGIVMNACVYSSVSILSKLAFNLSGYQETSPFLPAADGKDEVVKIIVRSVSGLLFTTIDVVQEEFDYSFENLCIEKTISDSTQIVKILGYLPTEPIAGQECSIDIRFKIQLITRSGRLIPIYGNHFYMTIDNILYRTPSKLWSFINPEDKISQNRWLEAAGLFSYDNTARFHYPLIPSFDTPDPLAEKYPQFSPYAHCAGNPLRYVDRDGMDVWEINHRGEIVQRTEDTTQDAFHMVDKNGNRINGKELSFPYGSISNSYSAQTNDSGQFQSFDVYELTRDKNGTKLFEFLSDNTSVEWCQIKATDKANKNVNFLTTTHLGNAEYGQAALLNGKLNSGYQVREINHNHPNGTNYPSGLDGEANTDISSSKNVVVHYGDKVGFNIYLSDRKEYIQYSPQSTFYDFPISPVQLKEVVVPYKR